MASGIEPQPLSGFRCIYYGFIDSGNSINISRNGNDAHNTYIIASGTWNHSSILAVFPANGNQPVVREICKYNDVICTITNYGNWGFTVTSTSTGSMPFTIFEITKPA